MRIVGRGDHHLFRAPPALEVGMDHVALDRPGPHDRDLDDEIVEFAWAQARQHVHLRAAFDLEHAQRIPLAQHRVGLRVLARHGGELQRALVVIFQQVEALLDAGEHPQRQHVDLQDAQRLDIVLVPLDETAIGHGAIADRYGLDQRSLRENKPADMLREMPWHSNHLPC